MSASDQGAAVATPSASSVSYAPAAITDGTGELRGQLDQIGVPELLRLAAEVRFSGRLELTHQGVLLTLKLDRGEVVLAASDSPGEQLGEWLHGEGILDAGQYEDLCAVSRRGHELAVVLEERGVLTPDNVGEVLGRYMAHIGSAAFAWQTGIFRFSPKPAKEPATTDISAVADLVLRGVETVRGAAHLTELLGGMDARYAITDDIERLATVDLSTEQWSLVSLLTERDSVRDICSSSRLHDFRVQQQLLALWIRAVIDRLDEPADPVRDRLRPVLGDANVDLENDPVAWDSMTADWDLRSISEAPGNRCGALDGTNLPDVLRTIYVGHANATLRLQSGVARAEVHFHDGSAVAACSNAPGSRIADDLVRRGKLSAAQIRDVERSDPSSRLGTGLLRSGLLARAELQQSVESQIREILLPTFNWSMGSYSIVDRLKADVAAEREREMRLSQLSTAQLILEGVRGMTNFSCIDDFLRGFRGHLGPTADPRLAFQRVDLRPEEGYLLSRCDGETSLQELVDMSPLPEQETLRAVYAFLAMGVIGAGEAGPKGGRGPSRPAASAPKSRLPDGTSTISDVEVDAMLGRLDTQSHFELLGIGGEVTGEEVRLAFHRLAVRFRPDRARDRQQAAKLQSIFARLVQALQTLRYPGRREAYRVLMARGCPPPPTGPFSRPRAEGAPPPKVQSTVADAIRAVLLNGGPATTATPAPDTAVAGPEPAAVAASEPVAQAESDSDDAEHIGKYQIARKLGEGGMGTVYVAIDTMLDREVALKVIRGKLDEPARERFLSEARAAARLQHPNVIVTYDLGLHDDSPFLAMELLEGRDLKGLLDDDEPIRLQAGLQIVVDTCQGLAHCHERGIIHRDVKPENIFVLKSGRAKVMDFGIAKATGQKGMTQTGMVIGTPQYLSPEQIRGRGADPRSDIYSVGAILFEVISQRKTFEHEDLGAILYDIVHTPPPTFTELGLDVPEEIEAIVRTALQKDPEERFASMIDMVSALRRALPFSGPEDW